jgi:chloramphenicol-sensitive protein RarD
MNDQQKGLAAALFCFTFWGFVPIFFKYIQHVPALTIIAHRVVWGGLFLLLFLAIRERRLWQVLKLSRQQILGLLLSGALVVGNWLIFVWAVTHDQILATSLGYFINPLINVFLGLIFLGERLNKWQTVSLILACASTIFLGIYLGQPPWISLALALSFGFYGLVRKKLDIRPLIGLFWETAIWTLPCVIYLLIMHQHNDHSFSSFTWTFLVLAGLVTVLPLIGFNYAAKKLTLVIIGFMQYIAPSISFMIAVFLYGEEFTLGHRIAFGGIWLALILISWRPFYHFIQQRTKARALAKRHHIQ